MNIRNKNIGKYTLGLIFALISATANYKSYPIFVQPNYEKGTVVDKNDHMTLGKYPRQKFIIAFKFDNPNYGTQDISTTFSTWSRLNIASFKEAYPSLDCMAEHKDLYSWHHVLTGSCTFGRDQFAKEHNLSKDNGTMSIRDFITLTENAFGSDAIRQLKEAYN